MTTKINNEFSNSSVQNKEIEGIKEIKEIKEMEEIKKKLTTLVSQLFKASKNNPVGGKNKKEVEKMTYFQQVSFLEKILLDNTLLGNPTLPEIDGFIKNLTSEEKNGLKTIIDVQEESFPAELKKLGYSLKQQKPDDAVQHNQPNDHKLIIWCEKDNLNQIHTKCNGLDYLGNPTEGVGESLKDALQSFLGWGDFPTPFYLLKTGDKFRLMGHEKQENKNCPWVLEKINEVLNEKTLLEWKESLAWSSKYVEGPHAEKLCLIPNDHDENNWEKSYLVMEA